VVPSEGPVRVSLAHIFIRCLQPCLVHSKCSVNVSTSSNLGNIFVFWCDNKIPKLGKFLVSFSLFFFDDTGV
jgi:hypothetical protein